MSSQNVNLDMLSENAEKHRSRGYQLEMLDESLKQNTIVTMDTGSGKTHVYVEFDSFHRCNLGLQFNFTDLDSNLMLTVNTSAILRIMAEFERCSAEKIIWFLAPTVALCMQQHDVISLSIPAIGTKLLIGSDNVDRWSEQKIWDAALKGIRIVVSTHAVLADALSHGFVPMSKLALLIFDEAHHCTGGHPANKIMRDFYHPTLESCGPDAVPHILGLTASPVVKSKLCELITIEANLHSICKTPRKERHEMLKHVHRPKLLRIQYTAQMTESTLVCRKLIELIQICQLAGAFDHAAGVHEGPDADNSALLRKFCNKAKNIFEELGPWAADYFIEESMARLKRSIDVEENLFLGSKNDQKARLLTHLDNLNLTGVPTEFNPDHGHRISPKLEKLILFLVNEDEVDLSGLVFVRQRATVGMMSKLLSMHPKTSNSIRCAPFVGMSNNDNRKRDIGELLDIKVQNEALVDFRDGRKNLIITTDVLEEGIDVNACRLVICYNSPQNLKSFVQRRGRARQMRSTFAILVDDDAPSSSMDLWQKLEDEMVKTYQEDGRQLQRVSALEDVAEDVLYRLEIKSTGALLTGESAMSHLHHFCARLPSEPYVDLRPAFSFSKDEEDGLVRAGVTLPSCLTSDVRYTSGQDFWRTERAAKRDAAFHAYKKLHNAGLVNDNLLPLTNETEREIVSQDQAPSTLEVSEQFDPWMEMAKAWSSPYQSLSSVSIRRIGSKDGVQNSLIMLTPTTVPHIPPFSLYWDKKTTFTIQLGPAVPQPLLDPENLERLRRITHTLLWSTQSHKDLESPKDFVVLFGPAVDEYSFQTWLERYCGARSALEQFISNRNEFCKGLIRNHLFNSSLYVFRRWHVSPMEVLESRVELECVPLPRRRNFLHRNTLSEKFECTAEDRTEQSPSGVQTFLASDCTVDNMPFEQARSSLFIPAILQQLEVFMVANQLRQTILRKVSFKDVKHITSAIASSSTQWISDYQRLEFFGDSILKFIVSYQLFVEHLNWHEGYLSVHRSRLVSNSRLARAALTVGLDAYILTKPFTSRRWKYPLVSESTVRSNGRRPMSGKILADVVEALIGAAFMDGGLDAARVCAHIFIADINEQHLEFRPIKDPEIAQQGSEMNLLTNVNPTLLVNYDFKNKYLFREAMTHPSCERDAFTESYQRLEFLGDAVLDMVVVLELSDLAKNFSHGQMSLTKAALVNGNLLAFLCLETSWKDDTFDIKQGKDRKFHGVPRFKEVNLSMLMRHHSQEIMSAQQNCMLRHQRLRLDIKQSIQHGKTYPWAKLAQLNADKFYSDVIESTFGAIFLDSEGSLEACRQFAEHIGILPYLRRIVFEDVDITHPRDAFNRISLGYRVEYHVERDMHDMNKYRCLVKVDDAEIAQVEQCFTKDEAIARAADAAVQQFVAEHV